MFTHSFSLLFRERLPGNWRALRYAQNMTNFNKRCYYEIVTRRLSGTDERHP